MTQDDLVEWLLQCLRRVPERAAIREGRRMMPEPHRDDPGPLGEPGPPGEPGCDQADNDPVRQGKQAEQPTKEAK
jgi:hypothetical protein